MMYVTATSKQAGRQSGLSCQSIHIFCVVYEDLQ
jgi:hypothetical protein